MSTPGLQLKVDGQWLRAFGAWGDLTYSYAWGGGCREASWSMTSTFGSRLQSLRRGVSVEIYWGGWRIWGGYLSEPEWSGNTVALTANGLFRKGEQYMAFADTAASATTTNPTTAINAATGIGWTIGAGIPNNDLPATTTASLTNISALLDAHAQILGQRWQVDQFGVVTMSADPTTVTYLVRQGVGDLGIAEDNYASHVVVRYANTADGYSSAIYPTPFRSGTPVTAYESRYGHLESVLDATDKGPMADADAASLAQSVYTQSKQRPGWTNGLQLAHGELLTPGWKPVHPAAVMAGQRVRMLGVPDEVALTSYTEFVIGSTEYKDGEDQITVNPVDLASRSQEDVFTELLEAMYPDTAS